MESMLSLSGETPPPHVCEVFDGVGMIRGEYLLRSHEEFITVPDCQDRIVEYLGRIADMFFPQPVWYRAIEMISTEANTMKGIDRVIDEFEPMKGLRGLRRGLALPDSLQLEIEIVARAARQHPNLHLMFPFVGDAREFAAGVAIAERAGWPNEIGSMVEIPSAVLDAPAMIEAGATNLMVGMNDLTSLLTGGDRSQGYADKFHPVVWRFVDLLAETLPASARWGIAGNLDAALTSRAEQAGAHYTSIHYFRLEHHGFDVAGLPEHGMVPLTKIRTRSQIRAREIALTLDELGIAVPWRSDRLDPIAPVRPLVPVG